MFIWSRNPGFDATEPVSFGRQEVGRILRKAIVSRAAKGLQGAVIGIVLLFSSAVLSQDFPNKPIRLSVGFGAGGSTDVAARIFAQKMGDVLGQPVIVENRAGAAGAIAADQVAKAEPDGYRLMLMSSTTILYSVFKPTPFDMIRDLTPISLVSSVPLVLIVHPSVKANNVNELITLARANPGKFTFSSEGTAATSHLAGELFRLMAKVDLLHVPFKSGVDSATAVAAGQVDMSFPALTTALPLLNAGKYRAFAVTGAKRSPLLPSVPTLDELGLTGYNLVAWQGFFGPGGMPKNIVQKLNTVISEVAKMPEVKEVMALQAQEIQVSSPEELAALVRRTASDIAKLAKDAGIKIE